MSAAEPMLRRGRRRRWPWVLLVVLLVVLALLAIAAVIGDRIFRSNAERQIEQTVEAGLPKGVHGTIHADIEGASAIQQYLSGRFDEVDLTTAGLTVAGAPASATVKLVGLPVHGGNVVVAAGDLTVGQAAFRDIPALQRVHASDPVLGSGTVSTTLVQSILGLQVKVKVVTKPSLDAQSQVVHLEPTAATLTAGPASVPATAIVKQLLPDGVSVCAAQYLPRGVTLTSLAVVKGAAKVHVEAQEVDLAALDSGRTGSCS